MITIIITTKNEEKNIINLLDSIHSQKYINYINEIIIVDNFSDDKTMHLIKNYKKLKLNIITFGVERSQQRNKGILTSNSKYILYLDADMLLPKNFVFNIYTSIIQNPDIQAFYIDEKIIGKGLISKVRDFERGFYTGTYIDCVRLFTKDAFLKVGGFDESLCGPEDWDFNNKINENFLTKTINASILHNEENKSFFKYLKSKLYYSKDFSKYNLKWKNSKYTNFQFSLFNRYFLIFLSKGKFYLLKNLHLYFIFLFYKFFVGIIFLYSKLNNARN